MWKDKWFLNVDDLFMTMTADQQNNKYNYCNQIFHYTKNIRIQNYFRVTNYLLS